MKEGRIKLFLRGGGLKLIIAVFCGALINIAGAKLVELTGLPLYLDTIGTIVVSVLGGFMPGIFTAVITNGVNGYFDNLSVYYAILNALIAICVAVMSKGDRLGTISGQIRLILQMAIIGGGLGGLITWFLYGPADSGVILSIMEWLKDRIGANDFVSHEIASYIMDLLDKAIALAAALLILHMIPQSTKDEIARFGWQQAPMSAEEQERLKNQLVNRRHSMRTRVTGMLVIATLLAGIAVTWVCTRTFSEYMEQEQLKTAEGVVNLAEEIIDPDMVDRYIKEGDAAPGYKDVEEKLYQIRDKMPDIEYVYVYRIEENGCRVVFDLDTDDLEGEEPGTLIEFDSDFAPYLSDLKAGKAIDPIVSDGQYGWLLTLYHPIYDSDGRCVCYAAADISMNDLRGYEKDFLLRIILVFSGFFVLILAFTMWFIIRYVILPINSMAECANAFAFKEDDDSTLEFNVGRIKRLEISTGDEVENLYRAFCKMTEDSVHHLEDIETQAKTIDEMQKGLIITMADMVEGRDADTGDHVQKTAAYADIILKGLKRKGYYEDQLSEKFMSDVVQSAPLHDIGKINVSDTILNKPGRLTDEEFEMMKTHTTAGREILDKTISTVNGESYLTEGRNLAAYHHEKWNGKGYPYGLKGEEIPLSARIMAVADVFDALASKRVYKDAMPFEKAVSIIREDAGSHFDPLVVEAFLDSLDEVKMVLDYYNARETEEKGEDIRR